MNGSERVVECASLVHSVLHASRYHGAWSMVNEVSSDSRVPAPRLQPFVEAANPSQRGSRVVTRLCSRAEDGEGEARGAEARGPTRN